MGRKKGKRSANKKKSKLLNGKNNPSATSSTPEPSQASSHEPNNNPHHHRGILYRRYKAATEAVKQWAWGNRDHIIILKEDDDEILPPNVTLSFIITTLHKLADTTTAAAANHGGPDRTKTNDKNKILTIPPKILSQLDTAIQLRRKVSHMYQHLVGNNGTTKQDYDGHAWIIDQLQAVYEKLRVVAEQQVQERLLRRRSSSGSLDEKKNDVVKESRLHGFAALALDDDEEDDDDEESVGEQKPGFALRKTEAERQAERELELKEERSFAIACTWMEIEQARDHIRDLWKEWSSKPMKMFAPVNRGELLGVTCASRYNCQLVHTAVARTCVEFDMPEDAFVRVIAAKGATPLLQEGRKVSWSTHLYGSVVSMKAEEEGHVLVQPDDSETSLSVPIKDLVIHDDDLLTALAQVYHELKAFKFRSVPRKTDNGLVEVDEKFASQYLEENCAQMVFEGVHAKNRAAFVSIALQKFLPAWVAFANFGEEIGHADTLFRRYLREFSESRVVTLRLCFCLVALLDSCLVCMEKSMPADSYASAMSMAATRTMVNTLMVVCGAEEPVFDSMKLFKEHAHEGKACRDSATMIWKAHFIATNTASFWKPSTIYFPWMAGEYMMLGLGANFISSIRLPAFLWRPSIGGIHVYSMLRREGFIGRISALEESLIRIYSKRVWFRSGIPQRSQYLSSWQISVGSGTEAALQLKGKRTQRTAFRQKSSQFRDMGGMGVDEMSNLMKIIKFQSSTISMGTEQSSADIKAMAQHECEFLLVQPILKTTLLLNKANETLKQRLYHKASKFSEGLEPYYRESFLKLEPRAQVIYWALGLPEERGAKETMHEGLTQVAQCFAEVFSDPSCLLPENKSNFTELEFNQCSIEP